MLKKKIGTIIAVSIVSLGIGSAASANQTGPATIEAEHERTSYVQSIFGGGGSATAFKFQGGSTKAPATFTQKTNTSLNLTNGGSTTTVTAGSEQSTETTEPSQVSQAQVENTSAVQVDATFSNGKTMQHQAIQRTSVNYQLSLKTYFGR
jgi:hypothetical protein